MTIISFSNAVQGRWGSEEGHQIQRAWYRMQTNRLLDQLALPSAARREILKYDELFQAIDSESNSDDKAKLVGQLYDVMKSDLGASSEPATQ